MNDAAKQIAAEPATAHDVDDADVATGASSDAATTDDDALLGDSQAALERSSE